MPHQSKRPQMGKYQAECIKRKKAKLDRYRPFSSGTTRHLNDYLRIFLTYHSNAIEGNSLSLEETRLVVNDGVTFPEHSLHEHREAINHAHAYQLVTSLAEQHEPITRQIILTLHRLVMENILEAPGQFRSVPVYIRGSNMTPPPAHDVERLMHEWIRWIYNEGLEYEAVTRAIIAHHGFEAVHPHIDGNGRVGRLLLDLMLMQDGYPPALLLNEWRVLYIDALMSANTGEYGDLLGLIGRSVEAGLDLFLETCSPSEKR